MQDDFDDDFDDDDFDDDDFDDDDFDDDDFDDDDFDDDDFDDDDFDDDDFDDDDFDSDTYSNGVLYESSTSEENTSLIRNENSNSKLVTSNSPNAGFIKSDDQSNSELICEVLHKANAYGLVKQLKLDVDSSIHYQKRNREELDNFFKKIDRLNHDDCKSLVFAHNMYEQNSSANIEISELAFKSQLVNIFKSQQYPIQYFNDLMRFEINNQLPDISIKWIKEDLRSALHFAYLVRDTLSDKALVGDKELVNYILNYLKYEVTHFNNTNIELPNYANDVYLNEHPLIGKFESVKSHYFSNRAKKEIDWLECDNSDQIEWAYNYLSSDKRDHLILQNIFIPVSLEDKYNLILASLDVLSNVKYTYETVTRDIDISDPTIDLESIPEISYRAKVIENMKDAWAKFSASNKNEDLSQIKIYKKDQDLLDSIKKAEGTTSASKVVGQLIKDEHDRIFNKK
ncbi:hypothetical protein [Psychrobacter jeotgali]|uniref:hypothetical protein n=1 Tax=Psychrobacter jeotgali TaxID=179010 RepID=UPI00191B5867|nr:hypothetical protein [Psychrobacter jeotgali]